ncbi:hypothetical protein LSAT2_003289 [Lamellibrachia satsuma]|nr:hypothetical protein LSAT2_003289 [Lamellibrachia satsuma]
MSGDADRAFSVTKKSAGGNTHSGTATDLQETHTVARPRIYRKHTQWHGHGSTGNTHSGTATDLQETHTVARPRIYRKHTQWHGHGSTGNTHSGTAAMNNNVIILLIAAAATVTTFCFFGDEWLPCVVSPTVRIVSVSESVVVGSNPSTAPSRGATDPGNGSPSDS